MKKSKGKGRAKVKGGNGAVALKACECGCKGMPIGKASRFKPGHDMKLRSALMKAGDTKVLKARGWA
jgi:hypothetical protein